MINQCVCINGNVVEDIDCTANAAEECLSCNSGYHEVVENEELGIKICMANICICVNGDTVEIGDCTVDGGLECLGCDEGYMEVIDDQGVMTCVASVCQCEDGLARAQDFENEFDFCPANEMFACRTCGEFFHIEPLGLDLEPEMVCSQEVCTCEINICICPNGQVVEDCSIHGAMECLSCQEGFHEVIDEATGIITCELNICSCANGFGTEGLDCETHDVEDCASCSVGYHELIDGAIMTCSINICFCPFGNVVADGEDCYEHGLESCFDCFPGYHEVETDDNLDQMV